MTVRKDHALRGDMTVGSPLKKILWFAVPLFIGNIFQQVYNLADTAIAGYTLGDNAIAAIGATSSLYSLLVDFASGMNSGFGIVTAQSFGAKNWGKCGGPLPPCWCSISPWRQCSPPGPLWPCAP